jgi:hypothetical protein
MTGELNLEEFSEVGIVQGPDGRDYSVRVNNNLPLTRQGEILKKMLSGRLKIEEHIYKPREPKIGSLKSDSD